MKKFSIGLLLVILAILSGMTACTLAKKTKITDIPVTTSSKDALNSVRQGLALMDQGETLKARDFFIKAIEQDPKLAVAYILKSGSSRSPKEFKEDLDHAKTNLEGTSNWEKMYYDFYETYLTNDWNKRLDIAKKIAVAYPDAPRALVDLGNVYSDGNENAQAKDCYQRALNLDTNSVLGYYACAMSFIFNEPKDFKKAEEYALKAVKLAPSSPGMEIALGDCYRAEDYLQKAKDAYSKAIALDPSAPEAYYKKGHANTYLGNFDEAREDYMNGGKHDRSFVEANNSIGYSYLYAGDYKAAMKWISGQAAKADSSGESQDKIEAAKQEYYYNCFLIAFHNQDITGVKEMIAKIEPLSIQIGNEVGTKEEIISQKGYILFMKALSDAMGGKYDAAKAKTAEIKTILEPIQSPTKLSDYEFAMGYICMKEKKYTDAISHFEKTLQTLIYNKYWLAMAYEAAGKEEKALPLFREISVYNFNEIGYALIRNEVKNLLAREAVNKKK